MTEKDTGRKKGRRSIVAVILLVIAGVLLVTSVFGFIRQGTEPVRNTMTEMRYEAALYAASYRMIDSYANAAYSAKQTDMRKNDPDFRLRGENANDVILNEVKEAARKEAEGMYGNPVVQNPEAFRAAVDQLTTVISESTDLEEKEKAVYREFYLQLIENVESWQQIAPEGADDESIAEAIIRVVPELGSDEYRYLVTGIVEGAPKKDESELPTGFVPMARNLAAKEKDKEDKEQVYRQLGNVTDWLVYADMEDDALWDKMKTDFPVMAEHEMWKKDIISKTKECVEAQQNETEIPSWGSTDSGEAGATIAREAMVDESYFTASVNIIQEKKKIDDAFQTLRAELNEIIPDLKKAKSKQVDKLKAYISNVLGQTNEEFWVEYKTYADNGGEKAITDSKLLMKITALAKYLLLIGIAILLLGLMILFWKKLTTWLGIPRTIITLFFIYLCLLAEGYRISVGMMLGNVLERMTMYGILVLAMMPGIQCGIGLNMGMTIGCISGLFGIIVALQYNMVGFGAMAVACLCGIAVALPLGWGYSKLLNRMKGNEMTISTYVGYSFVSLMCIGWMMLPFDNPKLVWPLLGRGMRVTHGLLGSFAHILDNTLSFKILDIKIPTGGLLFLGVCCLLMWLFTRSKTGIAMKAVGSNPRFAEASGISVNRMRTVGTVLSTIIAAVGIVIYSQAFGYAQLYTAPRQLGFIASSAILIGGATVTKAKVSHVLIGVFLFEGVLVFGQQIANSAVSGGGLSEVMRILISNGIILYALTQSGGGKHE